MNLTGTYDVNTPAGLVTVTLRVTTGGRLEGELRAGTGMLRLTGMTDGHRGEGTATNDFGAQVVFQVERSGDQLGIQLVDLATGGVDAVVLQRRVARDAPTPNLAVPASHGGDTCSTRGGRADGAVRRPRFADRDLGWAKEAVDGWQISRR